MKNDLTDSSESNSVCHRFPSVKDFDVSEFRTSLGMTQAEFAAQYGVSLSTLRKWEQHSVKPKLENTASILDAWITRNRLHFYNQQPA